MAMTDSHDSRRSRGLLAPSFTLPAAAVAAWIATVVAVPEAQSPSTCGLANAAFCETFDQGPAAVRSRGGDLDSVRWSAARIAPQDFSGFGPVANPVTTAPVPLCRAGVTATSVYPPDDTLICDATATRSRQLMTAVVAQNYGLNSYQINQPFDFAGRVGRIAFDVDAVVVNWLGGFLSIDITQDPVPAPTFREFGNYEHGAVPRNALMIKWSDNCLTQGTAISIGKVMVYNNYQPTIIEPSFVAGAGTTPSCAATRQNFLNHFEIQLSQGHLDIYGSDYSTDDGRTFPGLRKLYSADVSVPFTRGYIHVTARNHASKKYGHGPDWVYHWDNIGFDGPVIADSRTFEIRDNNTMSTYPYGSGTPVMNLGYQLLDGTTGKPAGIYNPSASVGPLQFPGVDVTGAASATLTMNAYFNAITHTASAAWGIRYRLNGGTWRDRLLTPEELGVISGQDADGNVGLSMTVPISDLRNGTNTLDLLPIAAPMDYPPTVANLNLVVKLGSAMTAPAPPTNLRIIKALLQWNPSMVRRWLLPA
jgi:hypothetical protein